MAEPTLIYVDVVCDLFHPGHVGFLRQARALGDGLIVGVCSDEDVATYKPRPIMNMEERMTILSACRYVDKVIPNAPLSCTRAFLDSIGAAYVCHGDDFPQDELDYWYRDLVGTGRLKVVPYTTGVSSREIVERVATRLKDGTLRIRL
jgi:cytidyltransferase-like protein